MREPVVNSTPLITLCTIDASTCCTSSTERCIGVHQTISSESECRQLHREFLESCYNPFVLDRDYRHTLEAYGLTNGRHTPSPNVGSCCVRILYVRIGYHALKLILSAKPHAALRYMYRMLPCTVRQPNVGRVQTVAAS